MEHWGSLEAWWTQDNQETKSLALALLTKALLIDQNVRANNPQPASQNMAAKSLLSHHAGKQSHH